MTLTPLGLPPRLIPTPEQEAIIGAARGYGSLMIRAFAGTAKSTTLGLAASEIKVPMLALAFNRSIAGELERKLASAGNARVSTLNGYGFGALRRQFPKVLKWELDPKKVSKLVTQVGKERRLKLAQDEWMNVVKLVGAAQTIGLVPQARDPEPRTGLVPDSLETWERLGDSLLIRRDELEFVADLAREVLERNNDLVAQGQISFDDQVYYPTVFGAEFTKYPAILLDEAQDLNGLNHEIVLRGLRAGGRLFVCGDPLQSIYQFRGAVRDSMGKMTALTNSWQHLGLTMTFRCPQVVVDRQQSHAKGFRASPSCEPGSYARLGGEHVGWSWGEIPQSPSVAVLCRNNAPLLGLGFKLLRRRIGDVMLGRDIGKGLIALCKKIEPNPQGAIEVFRGKLADWEQGEIDIALANGLTANAESIKDRAECLRAVIDSCEPRSVDDICGQLASLFAREQGVVTLSSIHKAKGLEWEVVLHLDPWRLPSLQAKRALAAGDSGPMEQEMNLRYVAETRTKRWLIEADLKYFVS